MVLIEGASVMDAVSVTTTKGKPMQENKDTDSYSKTKSTNLQDGLKEKASQLTSKPGEEGEITSQVENASSTLPSLAWLGLAVGSMAASAVILSSAKKKEYANFVGLWAPCFLLFGIYNKLVKIEGQNEALHKSAPPVSQFH
jgi:hypothetical protein